VVCGVAERVEVTARSNAFEIRGLGWIYSVEGGGSSERLVDWLFSYVFEIG